MHAPEFSSLAHQERGLLCRPEAVEVHLRTALAPRILIGMILARLEAVAPLHLQGRRGRRGEHMHAAGMRVARLEAVAPLHLEEGGNQVQLGDN